jgi:excisionase family DNA binding protein
VEEMTVTQVAEKLGKTDRTVRNYIKEGRLKARRIENQFGWEYRVYDLGEFNETEKEKATQSETAEITQPETKTETALQIVSQENQRLWEENRQLREINSRLAYDLGGRDQRIKDLEQSLEKARNLLPQATANPSETITTSARSATTGARPWWKKLFRL